jgi:adenosyl cobinamide kinase/adenosyl cobinamide phosphate guanylyltransferase
MTLDEKKQVIINEFEAIPNLDLAIESAKINYGLTDKDIKRAFEDSDFNRRIKKVEIDFKKELLDNYLDLVRSVKDDDRLKSQLLIKSLETFVSEVFGSKDKKEAPVVPQKIILEGVD